MSASKCFKEIRIYFPNRQTGGKIAAQSFQPILMFYNGNMKHWLSLISLKAFHFESSVQSKRGKAFFLVLSITHFPSNILSPKMHCVLSDWRKTARTTAVFIVGCSDLKNMENVSCFILGSHGPKNISSVLTVTNLMFSPYFAARVFIR